MISEIDEILSQNDLSRADIITLLACDDADEEKKILRKAYSIKEKYIGKKVWLRGLVEYSNRCTKNCHYCGIGCKNLNIKRYTLTDQEVLDAADFALKADYGSIVIQSGERNDKAFVDQIDNLLKEIKRRSEGNLGITLSCGEQSYETYHRWFASGAHRYLLRIETTDVALFRLIHPDDEHHSFDKRMKALKDLKKIGYQLGTGVMIGLPFQSLSSLADDLLFFKNFDVDMVGMGPYIEHQDTQLFEYQDMLYDKDYRFHLSLRMIAVLRIIMKDINIASTTALQAIDSMGREKALKAGANIIMPNLTPVVYKENYLLYEGKPCQDDDAASCNSCLASRVSMVGEEIMYHQWGDSKHFSNRKNKYC